jgi:hypothetical protein
MLVVNTDHNKVQLRCRVGSLWFPCSSSYVVCCSHSRTRPWKRPFWAESSPTSVSITTAVVAAAAAGSSLSEEKGQVEEKGKVRRPQQHKLYAEIQSWLLLFVVGSLLKCC